MMQHPSGDVDVAAEPPADAIETLFTYHKPSGDQPERYQRIREAAKALAREIDRSCPAGPDRTTAVRAWVSQAAYPWLVSCDTTAAFAAPGKPDKPRLQP